MLLLLKYLPQIWLTRDSEPSLCLWCPDLGQQDAMKDASSYSTSSKAVIAGKNPVTLQFLSATAVLLMQLSAAGFAAGLVQQLG